MTIIVVRGITMTPNYWTSKINFKSFDSVSLISSSKHILKCKSSINASNVYAYKRMRRNCKQK